MYNWSIIATPEIYHTAKERGEAATSKRTNGVNGKNKNGKMRERKDSYKIAI